MILTICIHGRFISHADRKDFWFGCFFFLFLSIRLERGDVTLSTSIFYFFCWRIQRSLARVDLLLSPLPLSTCEDLLYKSYLYLFRKSGTKFPTNWRSTNFLSGWEFIGTKKFTCLISLVHERKTRLSGNHGLSSSDLTS